MLPHCRHRRDSVYNCGIDEIKRSIAHDEAKGVFHDIS